jgi:zinc transport system substrate-binding protein
LRVSGRYVYAAMLVVPAAMLFAGCSSADAVEVPEPESRGGISVVTTIYPLEYFVRKIGGGVVGVVALVPPGAEAHTFELTASDMRTLAAADLVVMNGLDLEPWLDRALESLGGQGPSLVVVASEGVVSEADDPINPHLWLDPLLAIRQVEHIRDALIQVYPARSAEFAANADSLVEALNQLHAGFQSTLTGCRHDQFVTGHAAYGHLAARYNLTEVSLAGLSPESAPSAQHFAEVAALMESQGLGFLFTEPVSNNRLEESLARETGAELLLMHPLGSVTTDELSGGADYLSLMDANRRALAQGLECRE